jgi:hypothetical protein
VVRLIVLAVAAIAACTPSDADYSKAAAVAAAKSQFGRTAKISFYEIPSRGVVRDSLALWVSFVGIDTAGERGLVRMLQKSGPGPLKLLVSGPVPAKSFRIVKSALEQNEGRRLSHVQLLFVGPEKYRDELREAAVAAGVRLSFVSFAEALKLESALGEGSPRARFAGRREPAAAPGIQLASQTGGSGSSATRETEAGTPTQQGEPRADGASEGSGEVVCRMMPRDIGGGVIAPTRVCFRVKGDAAPSGEGSEPSSSPKPASLAGLEGVAVSIEELKPDLLQLGLRPERIQRDVEFKLRARGVRVYSEVSRYDLRPLFFLRVHPVRLEAGLGYSVGAMLYQRSSLLRSPTRFGSAVTWAESAVGYSSPPSQYDVRDALEEIADAFADDFLAANPAN